MSDGRSRALAFPLALGVCFFLSGAGSLVLEVVWTRHLRLVFGTTALAISTILVSYMAGLGIGGFLGGPLSPRRRGGAPPHRRVAIRGGLYALVGPAPFAGVPWLAAG